MSIEAWIDSIKGLYPGGFPLECLEAAKRQGVRLISGSRESKVIFFTDSLVQPGGAEFSLFEAMVTKGLKIEQKDAALVVLSDPAAVEQLKKELAGFRARYGIVLGTNVPGLSKPQGGSRWAELCGLPVVVTKTLGEVVADQALKRTLWEDLKLVLEKLA